MNICFAACKDTLKKITKDRVEGFDEVFAPIPEKVDVLVLSGDCDVTDYTDKEIEVCIFGSENSEKVLSLKKVRNVISCGMESLDSVTFSSIGDENALACIRRRILFYDKSIEPCEFKVRFDTSRGIYYNLVVALLTLLSENGGSHVI